MIKRLFFFILLVPIATLGQVTITGRVLNYADGKPIPNASVFLSNATIGDKTAADGTFILRNVNAGKYELVVSFVGYEAFGQPITVAYANINLPDFKISPKIINLKQVVIKPQDDPDRVKYYQWFKTEFIGTSDIALDCKILNPQMLDFDYDPNINILKASSQDFLEIENAGLGYKLKYLVNNFVLDIASKKVFYKGSVFFEEMNGTPAQKARWERRRESVYEGSEMHFLRSALGNRLEEEGFRAQQLSIYANPERPADSLIELNIKRYKALKTKTQVQRDSLTYWVKKSKLPKIFQKLMPYALDKEDLIKKTNVPGQYAIGCENDDVYVAYSQTHHYRITDNTEYLEKSINAETTLISFNAPFAFFYSNGVVINPYSITLRGVWGRERIAELLPVDYDTPKNDAVPRDSTVIRRVAAKLNAYTAGHITEKAYLHFDKPYYAAGDTMYFKAYLTAGENHQPSDISTVLHVDLVNTAGKVDQSINLHVIDGVSWGDFALKDSLPKGNYQVRAYSRWMLKDGPANCFNQAIPVGSVKINKTAEAYVTTPAKAEQADVQFFPEGGRLVAGINAKIAFKAIGSNGLGLNIRGVVTDDDNKVVTTFASEHLGMGFFYLQPAQEKSYKAKITFPDSSQSIFALPEAIPTGITLSVSNEIKGYLTVKLMATNDFYLENKNKDFSLVMYPAGEGSGIICKLDSQVVAIDILKQSLRTGINSVTLFSPAGEPVSERLFFVQNNDQLNLSVSSGNRVYKTREKVSLKFNMALLVADTTKGHFSVSVIDERKVPFDENGENTILTNLLLTSDLKGYIEQPNYYFTNTGDKTNGDLDLVMLTHGYRKFEWEKLLNNEYPPISLLSEKGLEISGVVKTDNGKPLNSGAVSLLSMHGGPVLNQDIDKNGAYHFNNLSFDGNAKFVIRAVDAKSETNTLPVYIPEPSIPVAINENGFPIWDDVNKMLAAYLANRKMEQDDIDKYGPINGILLKEVKIKDTNKDFDYPTSSLAGAGFADQVIHRKDFLGEGRFSSVFAGRLMGVVFKTIDLSGAKAYLTIPIHRGENPPMLVVYDGVEFLGSQINLDNIYVSDIETVEVLRFSSAGIYGARGAGGVLVITSRRGGVEPISPENPQGILPIFPKGYYIARTFYSPKYDHQETNFSRRDLRSTIYWNPEITTDSNGKASFSYYNADGTGSYRVVVEGMDDKGRLGRQVYRYKVE
ncbi:carboxypeptidase regulatory-like domain-containing protein [Mucilaginibacter sp.]|uniref:carboxypeptidase regulatory-like domain-containing protein n=1 Tax=Mucilaginibacter sp. TaxID=1882438 RepID=UPI00283DBE85|nr:carboxypeptidase regulatory-like domain-containing protein [Mucilaginibacter sp.]MDR3694575.1 carboxypeptidase regulatory-like domain-containing protein [Mucilaginibacter sp.]